MRMHEIKRTVLLIADISGYTEFMTRPKGASAQAMTAMKIPMTRYATTLDLRRLPLFRNLENQ
jgi:hypothetical protein